MLVNVTTTAVRIERLFLNNSSSSRGGLIYNSLTFNGRKRSDEARRKMRNNETEDPGNRTIRYTIRVPSFFTIRL